MKVAEKSAQRIIHVMAQHGTAVTDVFSRIVKICQGVGEVMAGRLKR